jgi:GTP:adenosylcobinamide-phosphate guanylyltransferase
VKAAILAGGGTCSLAEAAGVASKALVPVAGKPLVRYVVEALGAAQTIEEAAVVCGPGLRYPEEAVVGVRQVEAAGPSYADTIRAAAETVPEGFVCILTADMPALTPAAVDATVNFALDSGADLTYTICDVDTVSEAFPGTVRTVVRLREGRFTGGNLAVARREMLLASLERIESAFGRRKSIVGLTLLFGPMFLLRLLLARPTVAAVAARGEQILGCKVAVHASAYPEIAMDVDKPSDVVAAERYFATRSA